MTQLKTLAPSWDTEFAPFGRFPTGWFEPMERFMAAPFLTSGNGMDWRPQMDVTETADRYVFKAEVPGIRPEDIKVSVTPNGLTLSGEKTVEKKKDGENCVRTERTYGAFQRFFSFPESVDAEKVEAKAKDGVLTVTVDKARHSKVHEVKVKGG